MNCPKCEIELETAWIGAVEVDRCPDCLGIWFEEDELRQAKDEADPDLNWMDFELWTDTERFEVSPGPLRCPECSTSMVAAEYGDTGVEFDTCPICQGVWLQTGQFEAIVDALQDEVAEKTISEYVRASLKEAKEILTGPEGPISEWNDLLSVLRMLRYRLFAENAKLTELLVETQQDAPFR